MEQHPFEPRLDLAPLYQSIATIRDEIARVLVGQDESVEFLLAALFAEGHVLLEGVPGVAKTLLAKLLARTLDIPFTRIQFTPDLMPGDVIGTTIYNPKTTEFEFRKGPIFGHVILIDEVNRAPAKTQSALFEVMEERCVTVDGITYPLQQPFLVIATQNPVEHEGTYHLPEAQVDRFAFKLLMGYPTMDEEVEMLARHQKNRSLHEQVEALNPVLNAVELQTLRALVHAVRVEPDILRFIAQIIQQTRTHGGLLLGASPRGSVTLLHTARAMAALKGRDFVTPDDVLKVSLPALRHRIYLSAEKEMDGSRADDILKEILRQVEVPR